MGAATLGPPEPSVLVIAVPAHVSGDLGFLGLALPWPLKFLNLFQQFWDELIWDLKLQLGSLGNMEVAP